MDESKRRKPNNKKQHEYTTLKINVKALTAVKQNLYELY